MESRRKIGGTQEEIDAAQDQQLAEAGKRFTGLFKGEIPKPSGGGLTGTDIDQRPGMNVPQNMQPRQAIPSTDRTDADGRLATVLANVANSDKMNQMKQLEELESVGAFEDPNSEANVRAAKLRALLGK